jgi:hypothetical protein
LAGLLSACSAHFESDVFDGARFEEIKGWGHSLRILELRLMEGSTGNSAGGSVNLHHSGNARLRGGLVCGEVVGNIEQRGHGHDRQVIGGPRKRTYGGSDVGTLAKSVRLNRHGLTLREARLLNRDPVQQNSGHGDVIDGRVHEYVRGNAGLTESRGGYLNDACTAGSAGGERDVKVPGTSDAVGRDIQN